MLLKYFLFVVSYVITSFLLNNLNQATEANEKTVLLTVYFDLAFLMIILMLSYQTRNYFLSMGLALIGNAFALALIALSMLRGCKITDPMNLTLFTLMALFLSISFETIQADHNAEMEEFREFAAQQQQRGQDQQQHNNEEANIDTLGEERLP